MPLTVWQPGIAVASPAYLDASFLVAALVRRDARYAKASQLLGDLLVNRVELIVSPTTITEAMWAITKLSYCELMNQRSSAHFNPTIYRRHHAQLVARYEARFDLIPNLLSELSTAGVPVLLTPNDMSGLRAMASGASNYMRMLKFASADAAHLALAVAGARAVITTDSDFQPAQTEQIDIVLIQP